MFTFVKKVYKNRKKDYYILLIILTLIASFEFCSLAIYSSLNRISGHIITKLEFTSLPTLSTFVGLILSTFVLKYFIENKKQEFSILLLSGRKPKDLFMYVLYQFGFLSLFAFIIGIGIGSVFIIGINSIIKNFHFTFLFHYSLMDTIFIYLYFFIFTNIFILTICSHQFVNLDKNLVYYLNHKESSHNDGYKMYFSVFLEDQKKKNPIYNIILSFFVCFITIYSSIKLLDNHLASPFLILYYFLALIGIILIVKKTVPLLYHLLHNYLIKHPILLNALACFQDFSSTMMTLIVLNASLVPTVLFIVISSRKDTILQIIIMPCFIMILIMIVLCFVLRYSIYNNAIRKSVTTIYAIGYTPHQIQIIFVLKNMLFALFAILIPLLLFTQLSYIALIHHYLSIEVIICLSLSYIILYFMILIYIFVKENQSIKEVTNYVKYLNRS